MYNNRHKKCCQLQNKVDFTQCDMDDVIEDIPKCSNIPEVPEYNCDCGFDEYVNSQFPENPVLGQSYVPIQTMKKVFNPEVGLKMGTIYPELVSPYYPCQSIREINYLKNRNEIGEGCNK